MNILIPPVVKSNYEGYKFFIKLYYSLHDYQKKNYIINFEQTKTFEANLSAILRAINDTGREKGKNIEIINAKNTVKDHFILNGFFENQNQTRESYSATMVIPFNKFTPFQDIEFMQYVAEKMLSNPNFPEHSKMLSKKINTSIFELFENARTHGNCKNIYTCGQITDEGGNARLDFTIVDMGKTIKNNVNEYLGEELNGTDAISWAMESGHTTKTGDISGGLGLDIIFEFIKLNKGKIQIVSSDGYWEFSNNEVIEKKFEKPFLGTIANIEVNLNDKSKYKLKEEISLKDIF